MTNIECINIARKLGTVSRDIHEFISTFNVSSKEEDCLFQIVGSIDSAKLELYKLANQMEPNQDTRIGG